MENIYRKYEWIYIYIHVYMIIYMYMYNICIYIYIHMRLNLFSWTQAMSNWWCWFQPVFLSQFLVPSLQQTRQFMAMENSDFGEANDLNFRGFFRAYTMLEQRVAVLRKQNHLGVCLKMGWIRNVAISLGTWRMSWSPGSTLEAKSLGARTSNMERWKSKDEGPGDTKNPGGSDMGVSINGGTQ